MKEKETLFICPACHEPLFRQEHRCICANGHSFDIARQGYVHLVMPNKLHSKLPGDTKEMVEARRNFLEKGFYSIFRASLCTILKKYAPKAQTILDAGSGEGYYTSGIKDAFPDAEVCGIDISKAAVRSAAGKYKDISFAVASAFELPFKTDAADVLTDVFAPIVEKEFFRVLKPGGILVLAVPGERHLFGLKEVLYERPYENEIKDTEYDGFTFLERVRVKDSILLENHEDMWNLFSMTPYFWKTDVSGGEKLKNTDKLETEIHFDFLVYRKNQ